MDGEKRKQSILSFHMFLRSNWDLEELWCIKYFCVLRSRFDERGKEKEIEACRKVMKSIEYVELEAMLNNRFSF